MAGEGIIHPNSCMCLQVLCSLRGLTALDLHNTWNELRRISIFGGGIGAMGSPCFRRVFCTDIGEHV